MVQRRFGPTQGAGVAVIEEDGGKTIEQAALGVIGGIGVLERGPIGELIEVLSKTDFKAICGSYIKESYLPDAMFDFWTLSKGAGRQYLVRVTDGTEKIAEATVYSRKDPRTEVMKVKGRNAGRWAGRKQTLVGEYSAITQITLSTGRTMLEDELKDAIVTLNGVPGKSYKVVSNDESGVLTFAADTLLVDDVGLVSDKKYKVELVNEKGIGFLIKDGLQKPDTEFGMEVYDNGVLVKNWENLSIDPDDPNYFESVINDDTSNYYVEVEDVHVGAYVASARPSNFFGVIEQVTATKLTARIHHAIVNSANGGSAVAVEADYGSEIVPGKLSLTCAVKGSHATSGLTFGAIPDDGDTIEIDGVTYTFKTTVSDSETEIQIGGTVEECVDNTVTFLYLKAVSTYPEKSGSSALDIFVNTAGVEGNGISTTSTGGANKPTWGGAVTSGGVAQTWDVVHDQLGAVGTLTAGVAFVKPNEYTMGLKLLETSRMVSKEFDVGDTVDVVVQPFEPNALVGEVLVPDATARRIRHEIVGNNAYQIDVKSGVDLTTLTDTTKNFVLEYKQELGGGYDGVVGIGDVDYTKHLDPSDSPFNDMFGKNVGLVKLCAAGVASTAVQKAGAFYAESRNYQWRYECPSNITTESAAEQWLNDSVGRNDFGKFTMNSWAWVNDPNGEGLKLVPTVGMILGREALIAKNYDGYHKAGTDVNATLPAIVKLTTGNRTLNEEFLNPQGIQVIKKVKGNFVIWGDRSTAIDPAWKFAHKREYVSHQENIIRENFDWIVFAINSKRASTQQQLITAFNAHYLLEYNKGALEGDSFQKAFVLKVDDENNTLVTRAAGDLNAALRFRVVDTVERLVVTVGQLGIFESTE